MVTMGNVVSVLPSDWNLGNQPPLMCSMQLRSTANYNYAAQLTKLISQNVWSLLKQLRSTAN